MAKILGIAGSLRKASFNRKLLAVAAGLMPDGSTLEIGTIDGVPLYNQDVEDGEGMPLAVTALKDAMRAADGVLMVTPEYNNGIPGVFKNAIDWASRPPAEAASVFAGRPFGVIGASPGGFGTILSQNHWLPVLRTLGANLWTEGRFMLSRAGQAFDADGKLANDEMTEMLRKYLAGFVEFVEG